jgi:hypothetical protein
MVRAALIGTLALGLLLVAWDNAPGRQRSGRLTPTNLKFLNTPKDEDDPYLFVSPSGGTRRLFYASNASGRWNIIAAAPDDRGEWVSGEPIESLDPATDNRSPCLSEDGHDFFFATRIGVKDPQSGKAEADNFDIVCAIRVGRATQFTLAGAVLSVCTPNDELHPWITANGSELYFSRKGKDGWRLWVSQRQGKSGAFEDPKLVDEMLPGFHHATVTSDGMTMFVQGPLSNNRWGLFRCKRSRKLGRWIPWSKPEPLDNLNSLPAEAPQGDMAPCLSRDGHRLYFSSDRKGGRGGRDLWYINAPGLINGVIRHPASGVAG